MKFSEVDLKNYTFPSGAFGYKKKDVDDFLSYVAKDYASYQRRLEKSKQETQALETEKRQLIQELEKQEEAHTKKLAELEQENKRLEQELDDMETTSIASRFDDEGTLSLAQKVALRIEKQAEEEALLIKKNADQYHANQLEAINQKKRHLNSEVANSLNQLISSEEIILASIDTVRKEYAQLMDVVRENFEEFIKESK